MANDDFPRGLVPFGPGGPLRVQAYLASTATDLYLGMPVALDANGYAVPADVTAASVSIGAIVGFQDGNGAGLAGGDPFLDVSDLGATLLDRPYVLVADHPDQMYLIQEDTGGSALTQAAVGATMFGVYGATSGNDNTGWTRLELDRSGIATTTAGFVTLLQLVDTLNSDGTKNAFGNYAKLKVRLSHHQLSGQQAVAQV